LEDLTRDEVVAWGSFGREVVDDSLYFGIFESVGRVFELVRDSSRLVRDSSTPGKFLEG
jgi:hypothetical protein